MNNDISEETLTILKSGQFSFMSFIRIKGKPRLFAVTLKYKGKLYQFELSELKLIAAENRQEIEK